MSTEEQVFLANYKKEKYEKPSVTVDTIIFSTDKDKNFLQLLLIKRKKHPYKDKWAIPGGFVDIHENLDDAAKRELKEETNVDAEEIEQLYTFGAVNRDPRMRVISVAYVSVIDIDKLSKVQAADDASEAIWFTVLLNNNQISLINTQTQESFSLSDLAFDHQDILEKAFIWLRNKHQQLWNLTCMHKSTA